MLDTHQRYRTNPWAKLPTRGWRAAVFTAASATALVFLLNLSITIWALAAHKISYGSGILYQGSCQTTKQLNVGIHVIINVFSSIILGSSNYAMQCLSAPTREEVDEAHKKGEWLDIGVPSVRNLRRIAKKKMWLWLLLGVSSVPLHLFYNSVVFSTLSANEYRVYVVNEAWLSTTPEPDNTTYYEELYREQRSGNLERLDPVKCIDAYAQPFVSSYAHLLVVTVHNSDSNANPEDPELFKTLRGGGIHITGGMDPVNLDPYPWICDWRALSNSTKFCDVDALGVRQDPSKWKLGGRTVDYCLSQPVEEHCKVQLSITVAVLVTVLNFLKAALIFYVCFRIREKPLLNIGDAVASFLEHPDASTEGSCLLSREDAGSKNDGHSKVWGPRPFHSKRKRWFAAASRRRRIAVYASSTAGLLVCTILLIYGVHSMPGASASAIWSLGFGQATSHTLITFQGIRRRMIRTAGTLSNVLIANSGQAVLSFLYFAANGLLTSMLMSHEWSNFAHSRKALRVSSHPKGQQRSTYFLQLPWRYAIPLITLGTVLHWLASQSIFLVTVEQWTNEYGTRAWVHNDFWDFATCGYSPMALLFFVVVAAACVIILVGIGFRRFRSGMPVAGSCSLVIAAACHGQLGVGGGLEVGGSEEPQLTAQLPLQWGVVSGLDEKDEKGHSVRRCGFSSGPVEYPTDGAMYG